MTGRRKRANKRALKVPVLAGEVASLLKARHGFLKCTGKNRALIRADTVRKVEALRRDGDPSFVNLRNSDIYLIVMHASEMFWIASEDEQDVASTYSHAALNRLRTVRDDFADDPTSA